MNWAMNTTVNCVKCPSVSYIVVSCQLSHHSQHRPSNYKTREGNYILFGLFVIQRQAAFFFKWKFILLLYKPPSQCAGAAPLQTKCGKHGGACFRHPSQGGGGDAILLLYFAQIVQSLVQYVMELSGGRGGRECAFRMQKRAIRSIVKPARRKLSEGEVLFVQVRYNLFILWIIWPVGTIYSGFIFTQFFTLWPHRRVTRCCYFVI